MAAPVRCGVRDFDGTNTSFSAKYGVVLQPEGSGGYGEKVFGEILKTGEPGRRVMC